MLTGSELEGSVNLRGGLAFGVLVHEHVPT
jgi:hypothetical protein